MSRRRGTYSEKICIPRLMNWLHLCKSSGGQRELATPFAKVAVDSAFQSGEVQLDLVINAIWTPSRVIGCGVGWACGKTEKKRSIWSLESAFAVVLWLPGTWHADT